MNAASWIFLGLLTVVFSVGLSMILAHFGRMSARLERNTQLLEKVLERLP